jgi:YVTN family beta-propeller protein
VFKTMPRSTSLFFFAVICAGYLEIQAPRSIAIGGEVEASEAQDIRATKSLYVLQFKAGCLLRYELNDLDKTPDVFPIGEKSYPSNQLHFVHDGRDYLAISLHNYERQKEGHVFAIFDLASETMDYVFPFNGTTHMASVAKLLPDREHILVADQRGPDEESVVYRICIDQMMKNKGVDFGANPAVEAISVGKTPYGLAVSESGETAWVANRYSNYVSLINLETNTSIALPVIESSSEISMFDVFLSPTAHPLYVSLFRSNRLAFVRTSDNSITYMEGFGAPAALAGDGTFLYVSNFHSEYVSTLEMATNAFVKNIRVDPNPIDITVESERGILFASSWTEETISVVSLGSGETLRRIKSDLPGPPFGMLVH